MGEVGNSDGARSREEWAVECEWASTIHSTYLISQLFLRSQMVVRRLVHDLERKNITEKSVLDKKLHSRGKNIAKRNERSEVRAEIHQVIALMTGRKN